MWSLLSLCFFFEQKTADELRISDWSSDVCSSDLVDDGDGCGLPAAGLEHRVARRDLVLHLPDHGLFAGCLPAPCGADEIVTRLRAVRHLLPATGRRADRAPDRSDLSVPGAARRQSGATALGLGTAAIGYASGGARVCQNV